MTGRNRKWIYRTPIENNVVQPRLFEMVDEVLREPEEGELWSG